jgi:hypothetical protein
MCVCFVIVVCCEVEGCATESVFYKYDTFQLNVLLWLPLNSWIILEKILINRFGI